MSWLPQVGAQVAGRWDRPERKPQESAQGEGQGDPLRQTSQDTSRQAGTERRCRAGEGLANPSLINE